MTGCSRSNRVLRRGFLVAIAGMTAALAACATGGNLPSVGVAATNQELVEGYHVAAGDKLHVTVFDEAALTGDYQIGVGGELALPLIDAIDADGKTPEALAQIISDKLKAGGYVLSPRVSVEITAHRPFYILGEVKTPGEYPYSGDLTLDQAVAKAGGYTARADKGTILLRRQQWAGSKRVRLDGTPLKIAPGDTITVQEAFF